MKAMHEKPAKALGTALLIASLGWPVFAAAQETLIGFDDPAGLLQVRDAGRDTFIVNQPYREDGMVFETNVNPPDPRLGPKLINHFHLMYERRFANEPFDYLSPVTLPHPENEPRFLATMLPGNVIQMTYHPNGVDTPQPFNIKRVRVIHDAINVGVETASGDICVYNNLTAGFVWTLLDEQCSTNLVRVTFETPRRVYNWAIDDIVFEPFPPAAGTATAATYHHALSQRSRAAEPFFDPLTLMKVIGFDAFPPRIDIKPGENVNTIDLANEPTLRVAVLSTPGFDAASVDPHSVRFGDGGARALSENGRYGYLKDVDGDSDRDLVMLFRTADVGIHCTDNYQTLKGVAYGRTVIGFDFLRTMHCNDDANGEIQ